MRLRGSLLGTSLLVAGLLVASADTAEAESIWDITVVTSSTFVAGGTQVDMAVACPAGRTPISGGYDAGGGDVRHSWEDTGFGSGQDYRVGIDNEGGDATVTASVYCVPTSYFPNGSVLKFAEGTVGSDHLASASVRCDNGFYPLSASVSFSNAGGATVVASMPTDSAGFGWFARGWHELVNSQQASSKIWLFVNCVPQANVPGWKMWVWEANAGWGTVQTATCPSGAVAITGGATQTQSDGQGIINESHRSQANQWSARIMSLSGGKISTRVVCIAGANLTVDVSGAPWPSPNSPGAYWAISVTDPAAGQGYGFNNYCRLWNPTGGYLYISDCPTGYSNSGLTPDGEWRLEVVATSGDGRTATKSSTVVIDTSPPTVSFGITSGAWLKTTAPTIPATVTDALSPVTSLACAVDGAAPTNCGTPANTNQSFALTGLSQGTHTLHVGATDSRGNTQTYDLPFKVDSVLPVVSQTAPSATFTYGTSTTVGWTRSDDRSGIASQEVRARQGSYLAALGAWTTAVPSVSATSRTYSSLARGGTYCYGVRAFDVAGNVSPWTSRCTAVPLDDRDLTRSTGSHAWTAVSQSGWYKGTALKTTAYGATLSVSGTVKRIGLAAKKCPTCGKVEVWVGSQKVGTVNLYSSTTTRATLVLPALSSPLAGVIKVKVVSSGKLVQIDALGLSRV
jgi:hypothetical protein